MQPFVFKYMHNSLHLYLVFLKRIISDCHFLNEITCIKDHRGRILELDCVLYMYFFISVVIVLLKRGSR